jgi:AcrR family transcriptional regulator
MGTATTRQQILDATFATLADVGLAHLSLEDVAARAGVSRQTLYRHFGNRTSLVRAAIVREEERLLVVVSSAGEAHADLAPSLTAALTALLEWTRDHPLLARLLASEPEALLPLLTVGDAPVIAAARPAIAAVLGPRVPPGTDIDTAADVLARVMLSYAIDPPAGSPDEVATRLAALFVGGLGTPLILPSSSQ